MSFCECECHSNFSGPRCSLEVPTQWGSDCEKNSDCNQLGQICDLRLQQCRCDSNEGYILNQFQAELSYGQCVGTVTACILDSDCNFGQSCVSGRCACESEATELCLKDGEWECVIDPLPDCIEGILPSGDYGCCEQVDNWTLSKFNQTSSYCQNKQPESDPCDGAPCGFYGQCVANGNEFSCICDDHWGGPTCNEFDHCNPRKGKLLNKTFAK